MNRDDDDEDDDTYGAFDPSDALAAGSWLSEEVADAQPSAWCIIKAYGLSSVSMSLNLMRTSLDCRAAECLGLRLDAVLQVTIHFPETEKRPADLQPTSIVCTQPKFTWETQRVLPYGLRSFVPGLIDRFFVSASKGPLVDNIFDALDQSLFESLGSVCHNCPICFQSLLLSPGESESAPTSYDQLGAGMRLRPCQADACMYQWEEGQHSGCCLADLHTNKACAALDLQCAALAASSDKAVSVFEPFPTFLLKDKELRGRAGNFDSGVLPAQSSAVPEGTSSNNKRVATLRYLIRHLPPFDAMNKCKTEGELMSLLDEQWKEVGPESAEFTRALCASDGWPSEATGDEDSVALLRTGATGLLYRTLKFVLLSNRLTLHELVGPELRFSHIESSHQFAVLQANPERERAFALRRAEHGSFFAFHGAPSDCWFSIMRNSLRSLSGSSLMRHGAALGRGIYLAENASYSLGYTGEAHGTYEGLRADPTSPISTASARQTLALVECINLPEYLKRGHSSSDRVWVVPNDKDVVVRFLFVGTTGLAGGSCSSSQLCAAEHFQVVAQEAREQMARSRDEVVDAELAMAASRHASDEGETSEAKSRAGSRGKTEEEREIELAIAASLRDAQQSSKRQRTAKEEEESSGGDDDDESGEEAEDDTMSGDDDADDDEDDLFGDAVWAGEEEAGKDGADGDMGDATRDSNVDSLPAHLLSASGLTHGGASSSATSHQLGGSGGNATTTKLIAREYVRFVKQGSVEGLSVSLPDEGDVYRWECAMRPPADTPLARELSAFAEKHKRPETVQMEIHFTDSFPNEPPFIRIVSPRFAFHSGHITMGGSICTELLTTSGWSPAYTLESVLVDIRATIVQGDGRLDPSQAHVPYALQEAREAFDRVARHHRWIK